MLHAEVGMASAKSEMEKTEREGATAPPTPEMEKTEREEVGGEWAPCVSKCERRVRTSSAVLLKKTTYLVV